MPVVGWPKFLRIRHQCINVRHDRIQIQREKLGGVVEAFAHRIRKRGVLPQAL